MDALTSVVTISAAVCAILAAKERATELSVPYICILVTMCLLASILNLRNTSVCSYLSGNTSRSSSQSSGSSGIKGQAHKVNDSLYKLHRPLEPPNVQISVQIVLFHGLQKEDYSEAHLSTWLSKDGSCIWPNVWLTEEIPGVHVFSVSYSGDMKIIGENLLSDLLHGEIGQKSHCPVIFVGHSIGGLVIKQLCQQAHDKLHISQGSEKAKYEAFLSNLKGIFFYSAPHHGSQIAKKLAKRIPGPLFPYFKTLSKDTARLNDEFEGLLKVHHHWLIAGVSEGLPTNLGLLGEEFVVPEASARLGDFNVVDGTDHFSICQPRDKSSRSFYKLKELVHRIASEAQDAKDREVKRMQDEARARENFRPENFQFVPKSVIGLDIQVQAIKSKLDNENSRTLGLVGMGGLGKSTLAKEVFNRLAPSFKYTCFIPNVKHTGGDEMALIAKIGTNMYFHGKKVEKDQGWRTEPLLLVLDDTDGERDEKVLSEMDETMASESRIIFTTRNQCSSGFSQVYKVDFLNEINAKQLFLSYAFRDQQASAKKFERLTDAIITKCEGLPLALEVLGKFLGTTTDYTVWEQTLHAMDRAKDHPNIDERLWRKLRVSYDGLEENLQQIFLDAATFFSEGTWTLGDAKVAWRAAYDDCHESILWKKLVDMSLVYDVKEDEQIQLHEQLQNLGKKIASEPINNNRRRECDGKEGLRLLQNVEELHEKGIFALRVAKNFDSKEDDYGSEDTESEAEVSGDKEYGSEDTDSEAEVSEDTEYGSEDTDSEAELSEDKEHKDGGSGEMIPKIHITNTAVDALAEMRYLEINAPIIVDGGQICSRFAAKLVLLDCQSADSAEILLPALGDQIALLNVLWKKSCLPANIGSFSKLRVLRFYDARHLESLPDEIGKLSRLQELVLVNSHHLQTLPASFGNLSSLSHLEFRRCGQLQSLPESFGNLSSLISLKFGRCGQLRSLPESFGNLSSLSRLAFGHCGRLRSLPESFGNLSSLISLEFGRCGRLRSLPESFGNLSSLSRLAFGHCGRLRSLPESFGNLSSLNSLKFWGCAQLGSLPESFGNLSSLNSLVFYDCAQLRSLPESFGNLSSLNSLEFWGCAQLGSLPESFGNLSSLSSLVFCDCAQLRSLPESFGNLSSLNSLEFWDCAQLRSLPESFGNLSSLSSLAFGRCGRLRSLPESFGNLSSLDSLQFWGCARLRSLPESFGNLSSLNRLEVCGCQQLESLLLDDFGYLLQLGGETWGIPWKCFVCKESIVLKGST